jgi:4-amino-4-deoxychorismate lyase
VPTARYIRGQTASVDATDRGLAYGDGLFETMALRAGGIRYFGYHLERLAEGCERLAIPFPDRGELEREIEAVAGGLERGTIKLILTRGPGIRGYAPPKTRAPTVVLFADPAAAPAPPELTVATLKMRLGENASLAGIKHLCRLEQVLGRLELSRLEADEGLMLSTSGMVIGGTSRNLFAVHGRALKTPDLGLAGIRGVMRRAVLEHAAEAGYAPEESRLTAADLGTADEIFMTNALVGIQSVSRLDARRLVKFEAAERMRAMLDLGEGA